MFKKIVYIISVALIGFTVVLFALIYNMSIVHANQIIDATEAGDYTHAERYYSYVMDDQNKFYVGDHNGVHVEVYSALNAGNRTTTDMDGASVSYYSLENTIQFSLFNLPDSFDLVDYKDETRYVQGGVELFFEGTTKTVFFPFSSENYDFYNDYNIYTFLALAINVNEYNTSLSKAGIAKEAKIVSAKVYDGNHDADDTITIEFVSNPTFETEFFHKLNDVVEQYNALQEEAQKVEEVSQEKINEVQNNYINTVNNSGYAIKHDASIYLGSFEYIFTIIITCVVYAAAAILIGWFIFRKKKNPKYIPPSQKKANAPRPQPEQFSRDVFNVEEDDVVVEEVKEETKEPVESSNE